MKYPTNQTQAHEKVRGGVHPGFGVSPGGCNEHKVWEVKLLEERS